MVDFDYGNARLRALKARLLPRAMLMSLTGSGSVETMLAALNDTAYRPVIEAALARAAGLAALGDALRRDMVRSLARQQTFYRGRAAQLLGIYLRQFDVFNVITILRGVSRGVPPTAIIVETQPVGALTPDDLTELARADSTATVAARLANLHPPLAVPLLALLAEQPGADLAARERALLRWWAAQAWAADDSGSWRDGVAAQLDGTNIMVALRLVGTPLPPARLAEQFILPPEGASMLLPLEQLQETARAPDVGSAVAGLAETPYGPALAAALPAFRRHGRLFQFERGLARHRLRRATTYFYRDPLGVGVPLAYTTLKLTELLNLRLIGHGLYLEDPPEQIAARLVLP